MAATSSIALPVVGDQGELRRFRNDVYDCFDRWADALFELFDALSGPVPVSSLAHLTLAGSAMRGHGSAYAALADGVIDTGRLRDVLAAARPRGWRPDFAVDTSTWARCDAECSPGRGYYYHPSRQSSGQPIVAGWCYSWLVALSPDADSWTAPLDAVRLSVTDNANTVAVTQIRALLPRLGELPTAALFAFDGGYDPVQLTVGLAGTGAQAVVRVKNDRTFFARPPERGGGWPGRPPRHGTRFACANPETWHHPDQELIREHDFFGRVHVQAWHRLHPRQRTYHDPAGNLAIIDGTLIRVQVTHLPGRTREPRTLWLWWTGPDHDCDLDRIWQAYIRRFDIEHTLRLAKQTLGWTTPRPRTPEQADRWTCLILAAINQLRLARPLVADHRLPWQPPQPNRRMTPGRVRQGFGHLLHRIGTPASQPKHARPGPGRPKGRTSTPADRCPALKKAEVKTPKRRTVP
ncbi:NF041680 family putative transposase [Catellatospora methionotrophica]|uniref:NF041680 family putative transposase n=1 Tax=Catellatospora methionotrophica TaxID=121620 RepID=UPI0033FA0499